MAGTLNVMLRAEASLDDGSAVVGNLSRPKTITLSSGLKLARTFTLSDDGSATKIFDIADFSSPAAIFIEWTDGPIELAWGEDATKSNTNTSSFVSNDAAGGWFIFWGSGQYSHNGLAASDRNSIDGAGTGSASNIGTVWATQTSGASILCHVTAFK